MVQPSKYTLDMAIGLAIAAIFVIDILMPTDEVSISFIYTLPILLSILGRSRKVYHYAAITTLLSLVGLFVHPPAENLPASFYANRAVGILAQWAVAALVAARLRAEQLLGDALQVERARAERRQRFQDILSHEIGTSLTAIDGHAFRLARKNSIPTPEEIVQRSNKVRASVRHIQTLIQRVRLVGDVERNSPQTERVPVAIKPLILEAVREAGDAHPGATISVDIDALPSRVFLDPLMIRQIVENIVTNAAKYSPAGSPIRVQGAEVDGKMVLRVSDKGRGIPDDEISRVFTPYYRARNAAGVHGAGVGLYVSDRFAAAHGGTISISSQIRQGTEVTVTIPLAAPEKTA